MRKFHATETPDTMNFTTIGFSDLSVPLATSRSFRLLLARDALRVGCFTDFPATADRLDATSQPDLGGTYSRLLILGLQVQVDAYIQYQSP